MTTPCRFETMRTSYGRVVEVGRLCFRDPGLHDERVILDVPRQNPEYDSLWVALSPSEARALAGLLIRHAEAAEVTVPAAPARRNGARSAVAVGRVAA
jgi:hypothetical protein